MPDVIRLAALFVYFKLSDKKELEKKREQSDAAYREQYGEQAYRDLLNKRAAKPAASTVVGNTSEGIWHSRANPDKLMQLVELNLPNALIGTSPYRLAEIQNDFKTQEAVLKGKWPDARTDSITFLELCLGFSVQADGRTAVTYKYTAEPADDPFAKQAIMLTTTWLKALFQRAE